MPAAMHSFYLRKMYQENLLAKPGGITLGGVPIDLRQDQDAGLHPVDRAKTISRRGGRPMRRPRSTRGPVKFVLSASGHIAGVVNPPGSKYSHWTKRQSCRRPRKHGSPARRSNPVRGGRNGSSWIAQYGGGEVPARQPGDGKLKPIEDAPGSYVQVRGED